MEESTTKEQYDKINSAMRTAGVEAALRSGSVTPVLPYARPAKFGISQPEVAAVLNDMRDFDDWPAAWDKAAQRYVTLADGMSNQFANSLTARDAYVHASYIYHLAQLYCRDPEIKARLHSQSVANYHAASRYFDPPVSEVDILYKGLRIPGYLRLPSRATSAGRYPWALLVDGADTTKEEAHYQAAAFLERNLAVFYFDGPGQGELRSASKVELGNYEDAVSQIITDLLQQFPALDPEKIGIYGISTGGYLALRCACRDDRINAVVSVGGFMDARGYFNSPITTQESVRTLFGVETREKMVRFLQEKVSIRDMVRDLRRHQLIVYGGRDHLVPREEIDELIHQVGEWATLRVFEEGTHALQNVDHLVRPLVADWMAEAVIHDRRLNFRFIDGLW
jgi:2,6-dihydroxypseudooxynicotine hydrolase